MPVALPHALRAGGLRHLVFTADSRRLIGVAASNEVHVVAVRAGGGAELVCSFAPRAAGAGDADADGKGVRVASTHTHTHTHPTPDTHAHTHTHTHTHASSFVDASLLLTARGVGQMIRVAMVLTPTARQAPQSGARRLPPRRGRGSAAAARGPRRALVARAARRCALCAAWP